MAVESGSGIGDGDDGASGAVGGSLMETERARGRAPVVLCRQKTNGKR